MRPGDCPCRRRYHWASEASGPPLHIRHYFPPVCLESADTWTRTTQHWAGVGRRGLHRHFVEAHTKRRKSANPRPRVAWPCESSAHPFASSTRSLSYCRRLRHHQTCPKSLLHWRKSSPLAPVPFQGDNPPGMVHSGSVYANHTLLCWYPHSPRKF